MSAGKQEANSGLFNVLGSDIVCGSAVYQKRGGKIFLITASPSIIELVGHEGRSIEELKNIDAISTVYPEEREDVIRAVNSVFEEEKSVDFVFRRLNFFTGRYIWLYTSCIPLKQADGTVYACCSFMDIDRQKEVLEKIIKNRNMEHEAYLKFNKMYNDEIVRLDNCFDDSMCVIRYNISRGYVESINGETLSGRIKKGMRLDECYNIMEELCGGIDDDKDFFNIFDCGKLMKFFNSGMRNLVIEVPLDINNYTATLWVRFNITMHSNPNTDEIVVFAIESDITTEMLTKIAFQNIASEEYETILCVDIHKNKYFCIYTKDTQFYVNTGKYGRNGDYSKAIRRKLFNMSGLSLEEKEKCIKAFNINTLEEKLSQNSTYTFRFVSNEKGIDRHYEIHCRWIDKEHDLIIVSKKDITNAINEEKTREKQLLNALKLAKEANQAKTMFLSNMSHDMRTPLNGVIGFTNLAIETDSISMKNEYLEKIKMSGEFLVQLVNATLDLSKIESHKMVLNYQNISCEELAKSIINSVQTEVDSKNLSLIIDASKWNYDGDIYVDGLRVKQIFLNLISNSIKFTGEGGRIEFIIEMLKENVAGCNCKVIVRDNGIGMSKEFADKAFEPFAQDDTTAAGVIGTGLGLSIVHNLVKMMGGMIELESEEGIGTQFTVYLPIRFVKRKTSTSDKAKKDKSVLKGKKVLLCEDHPINIELAKRLLEKAGMNVVCAVNGKEGVEKFESSYEGEFDVIIMDIRMPVMDGNEAAKHIRDMDRNDASKIPIIAMTANAYDDDRKKAIMSGMTAHLSKPVDVAKLYDILIEEISMGDFNNG